MNALKLRALLSFLAFLLISTLSIAQPNCAQIQLELTAAGDPGKYVLTVDSDKPFSSLRWLIVSEQVFTWSIDSGERWDITGTHTTIPIEFPFNGIFKVTVLPGYYNEANLTYCSQYVTTNTVTVSDLLSCAAHIEPKAVGPRAFDFGFQGSAASSIHQSLVSWDFGDGHTSTEFSIHHQYEENGTYEIVLTRTIDDCTSESRYTLVVGCGDKSVHLAVVKSEWPGTFDFHPSVLNGTIKREDYDYGDPYSRITGSLGNHMYSKNGDYTTTYKVQTTEGCEIETSIPVHVTDAHLCGVQTFNIIEGTQPGKFRYVVDSDLPIVSAQLALTGTDVKWGYGSGTNSSWNGTHIDISPYTITNNGPAIASFALSYEYAAGKFCIRDLFQTIEVRGNTCSATINTKILSTSTIKFSLTGTNIGIKDTGTITWDFGDGETSTDFEPIHNYTKAGTFNVKVSRTYYGCTSTDNIDVSVCLDGEVDIDIQPTDNSGKEFKFSVASGDAISEVYWEVDDADKIIVGGYKLPNSPNADSYTYKLKENGTYYISVFIFTKHLCFLEGYEPFEVTDGTEPPVEVDPCDGITSEIIVTQKGLGQCEFKLEASKELVSYEWDFGDNSTSTEASPKYTYSANGTYTVAAKGNSADNCEFKLEKNVIITNIPEIVAGIPGSEHNGLSIYPNPSSGRVNFSKPVSGVIYDVKGSLVYRLNDSREADLNPGAYLLKTKEGDILKLIIK